jgi:hypothetical protein
MATRRGDDAAPADPRAVLAGIDGFARGAPEFVRALSTLKSTYLAAAENPQGFELKDCRYCSSCMFCTSCTSCYRCTHCNGCEGCSNCTHCIDCVGCHQSAYCTKSERCVGSKYLERCESCSDCTYCFACVGLVKKDFHILNVPYDKKTYFALVAKLRAQLG